MVDGKRVWVGALVALYVVVFLVLLVSFFVSDFSVVEITGNSILESILGVSSPPDVPTFVTRSFSDSYYSRGVPLTVTLLANIGSSDKIINYGVEESVPVGFDVVSGSLSDGGYFNPSSRKIFWIVNSSSASVGLQTKTLSYQVVPSVDSGTYQFGGNSGFSDMATGGYVFKSLQVYGADSISPRTIPQHSLSITSEFDPAGFVAGDTLSARVKITSPSSIVYDCVTTQTYGSPPVYSGSCTLPSLAEGSVVSIKAYNNGYGSSGANFSLFRNPELCSSIVSDSEGTTCTVSVNADTAVSIVFKKVNILQCSLPNLNYAVSSGGLVLSWSTQRDCAYMLQSTSDYIKWSNYSSLELGNGGVLGQVIPTNVGEGLGFRLAVYKCLSGSCIRTSEPAMSLSFSPSTSMYQGVESTATGICPSGLSCYMARNNELVSNPDKSTLVEGNYEYILSTLGNSVYSAKSVRASMVVNAPLPLVPSSPTSLGVRNEGSLALRLSWTDNSNDEAGFVIQRSTSVSGTFSEVGRVGQGVTTYLNSGLNNRQTYYYRVYAYSNAGDSGYSNVANAVAYNCKFLKKLFGYC
jgi:hypothetical protein